MSPPEQWGPPIWRLFHTLAAQLNDDTVVPVLLSHIQRICAFLPCPDCSAHATDFWRRVRPPTNKQELIDILYNFHNTVNYRKRKQSHNYEQIKLYNQYSIFGVFKDFIAVYNTNGNMKLLAESFQRKLIIDQFRLFLIKNATKFG